MKKSNEERITDFRAHVKIIPPNAPRIFMVGQQLIEPDDIAAWVQASSEESCALLIMCDMQDSSAYSAALIQKLNELGASASLMFVPQFMSLIFVNSNEEIEQSALAYLYESTNYAVTKVGPHLEKMEQATA